MYSPSFDWTETTWVGGSLHSTPSTCTEHHSGKSTVRLVALGIKPVRVKFGFGVFLFPENSPNFQGFVLGHFSGLRGCGGRKAPPRIWSIGCHIPSDHPDP